MKKVTNRDSRKYVQDKIDFKANNLKANWNEDVYVVWSYDWYPLFAYVAGKDKWYSNSDKYSVSTSKQYGQCHPHIECVELPHEELKKVIGL